MSFFDGINTQAGTYEASTVLPPIKEGTSVLASIEEVKNELRDGETYINVKWRVAKPVDYQNRVIYQKLRVYDSDVNKTNTAKAMLSAIAVNAGGAFFTAMQNANEQAPSDVSLSTLLHRPMVLKLGVWKIAENGTTKEGNLVRAVSPVTQQAAPMVPPPVVQPQVHQIQPPITPPVVQPAAAPDFDDTIPF